MVLDASGEAAGVQSGQSLALALALARCRDLLTLPADLTYYDGVSNDIGKALAGVVDRIEPAGWGRFYLGLDGMAEMYRGETGLFDALLATCQPEFRPRLGVARGKFPAFCAAALATAGEVQRVHGGSEAVAAWLATLPVGWLPLEAAAVERLQTFGIRTLGQLAALPLAAAQAQLGWAGLRAWELSHGMTGSRCAPKRRRSRLRSGWRFRSQWWGRRCCGRRWKPWRDEPGRVAYCVTDAPVACSWKGR